jgi:hypothetical protein
LSPATFSSSPPTAHPARDRVIVIAVLIALAAYVVFGFNPGSGSEEAALHQHAEQVVNASLSIPGNQSVYSLMVPADGFDASLQGNFTVTTAAQSSVDQVEMFVMDPTDLGDYQQAAAGSVVNALYSSGESAEANFDVQLPQAETYYVVFSLPETVSGPLDVQTTSYLIYTTCSGSAC